MSVYCWHNAQLTIRVSIHLNTAVVSVRHSFAMFAVQPASRQTRQHIHYRDVMGAAGLRTSSVSFVLYNTSPCYGAMLKWDSELVDTPQSNIRSHNTCDYVTLTARRSSNCLVFSYFKKIWQSEMPARPPTLCASQIPRWYFFYRLNVPECKEEFVRHKWRRVLCLNWATYAVPTSLLFTEYIPNIKETTSKYAII
jgi:hypothetical protein